MKEMPLYRIVRIVWMAITFLNQTLMFQKRYRGRFTPSIQEKWDLLVTNQAIIYKNLALELGGLTVKVGQFLSARADIMPPSFIKQLEGLTDRVTPVPKEKAFALLHEEIGEFLKADCISFISDKPIASASIGDVYKGCLASGTDVAIKIQRPNIEKLLRADFKALKIIIWFLKHFTSFGKQLNLNLLYEEMIEIIGAELNYLKELENGQAFAKRFSNRQGIRFPYYYKEYSTRRVLVMEWIEGEKITSLDFLRQHNIDSEKLSERLFLFFLDQLLESGRFHADPHSGNLLVQQDGTIAVIDFGMIITITKEEAQSLFLILKSILFKQYNLVVDGLEQLNFLLPSADKHAIAEVVEQTVDAYESHDLYDMNSQAVNQILNEVQEIIRSQPVQLPAEFAFLGRAVSVLTGVLHNVNPKIDLLAIAKPHLFEWVKKQTVIGQFFSMKESPRILLDSLDELNNIPHYFSSIMEKPARVRRYIEKRDKIIYEKRVHLQTRQFTGVLGAISLGFLMISIWIEHFTLLIFSGFSCLCAFFVFWRQSKK